ncbi:WYL domain-containing protein [Kitasatospora sp. NBC_00240]|uniref:helix-turn-helix transcriptional regulator n=1 Tax=Kitasatospora sp. NBC_00240 TaxID=2903567 RepID=UPI0022525A6C|nr:WYL domain-containing protein [Kitasatospora sp. NBC_00240]MCX5215097.1 WYL domain-containing protein [Kitasatospora sp. NBC_00240]
MSRPTGRVLTLLELLQSGGVRTVAELADRLGVDGRTVRRYVGQLLDLDVPVEVVRGRYGGYRIGPGYRLPPLMLSDDEALAVLLGLAAGRRAGAVTAADTASWTAAAKIRRVLPTRLARRLGTVLESLAFTTPPGASAEPVAEPDAEVLLTVADAVRHRRPIMIRYTDRFGERSERVLHAYGIVVHEGRWYVTGRDPGIGEDGAGGDRDGGAAGADRTFRLDRIAGARPLAGSFEVPAGFDPAQHVLTGFATAAYRYEVTLRIHGTVGQIRARLPTAVATLDEATPPGASADPGAERWRRVELRVEELDRLPPVLASLDRPFVIERPDELRHLVTALADRLRSCAREV